MQQKPPLSGKLCDVIRQAAVAAVACVFVCLALLSLVQTCRVDIGFSADNNEHVSFLWDNVLVNLVVLALLLLAAYLLLRPPVSRRAATAVMIAVSLCSAALGCWWVLASKAAPGADSLEILDAARALLAGNPAAVRESYYFYIFPFQLGYLLYTEGMLRIFGGSLAGPALLNVVYVIAACWAVFRITVRLFNDPRIGLLTAVLLGLCAQPVFLCTFLYGFLPGLACASWSLYFVIACMQDNRPLALFPAAVLIAAAILLKKNYSIFLIAEMIVLCLHVVRAKRWAVAALTIGMLALSLLLPRAVQKGYERRLETSFGEGTPMSAWLVTGLRESSFCSGWFSSYTTHVLSDNGMDVEKTRAQIRTDLMERIGIFSARPRYLFSFMCYKTASQWNEPAFQCVWSSASGSRTGPVSPLVTSMGTGPAALRVNAYFNQVMQFVYVGLAIGLILLLQKRRASDERLLLPLILLGAFLYHALFEAKSQYALIYVPLMLPYAALGFSTAAAAIRNKKRR